MSSSEVADTAGITYRQLDYLVQLGIARPSHRSPYLRASQGNHRRWPPDIARRLWIAAQFAQDRAWYPATSGFPRLAAIVLDGPEPPASGWAIHDGCTIQYAPDPSEIAEALVNGPDRPFCVSILPLDGCPTREEPRRGTDT